jgi:hypothetical protein
MEWLPPGLFEGVGIVAFALAMLTSSWWLLMRGNIHTDTEYQFVIAQLAARERQLEAKQASLDEALKQNGDLIEANRTITHVLEGLRLAMESRR